MGGYITNKLKRGFTLVELVIVVAIISILAGVLIPTFTSVRQAEENKIIDIYNNESEKVFVYNAKTITEEESQNYKLIDIKVIDNVIYLYFE